MDRVEAVWFILNHLMLFVAGLWVLDWMSDFWCPPNEQIFRHERFNCLQVNSQLFSRFLTWRYGEASQVLQRAERVIGAKVTHLPEVR